MKPISAIILSATMLCTISCSDNNDEPLQPDDNDTPYISVIDYSPAPGQFINEIPEYEEGDTQETINAKVEELLNNGDMISLGAWGGSVTLKLKTPIVNIVDKPDFRIKGNAIYANASTEAVRYGSAEPGIIMVMQDTNGNGVADDVWYEIKGDQTANASENYTVTYYLPDDNATDTEFIRWVASDGTSGYLNRNAAYHSHNFFPQWRKNVTSLTFSGKRLPDNGYYNSSTGNFDLICYTGYADSHPNNVDASQIDIDNAIDHDGNHVDLTSIDFIKIYTAVLQTNGALGECSTEVAGIEPLNQ